jgi:uncharacterized protein (DUF362 family)
MIAPCHRRTGFTRRSFLCGAAAGLAGGAALTWFGLEKTFQHPSLRDLVAPPHGAGIPGPFPGRVIEVHHPGSVPDDHSIYHEPVRAMVDRGMRELTATDSAADAWRSLFKRGDVVGIKVNPVGRRYSPGQAQAISSPELLLEVVAGLKSADIPAKDIIVFERYADQFRGAGYEELLRTRPMDGVRWYASSCDYHDSQLDIQGHDGRSERDPKVVGYDPDVFVTMGFALPKHDRKDDRRFRSHISVIVTRMVNKIINLPVLKDHGSAGVTLALKNLSHGLSNNVARSHLPRHTRQDGRVSGPNQCNVFIPAVVAQTVIRQKATLNIMDGLIGVYQGGPSRGYNWPYRSLFFATDPVAMDQVGWGIVDAQRVKMGWAPVGESGLAADLEAQVKKYPQMANAREAFDRRQPEHIILASTVGLGVFGADKIEYRRIELT